MQKEQSKVTQAEANKAARSASRSVCLLVLGMHRSGTSAILDQITRGGDQALNKNEIYENSLSWRLTRPLRNPKKRLGLGAAEGG